MLHPDISGVTAGASTTHFQETLPLTSGDLLLKELRQQLGVYTNTYLQGYTNMTEALKDFLKNTAGLNQQEDSSTGSVGLRRRRQVGISPDLLALQGGYSSFFGSHANRRTTSAKKKNRKNRQEQEELPVVLVPEEDQAECVSSNQLSSFGFLGFVLNVVNAVINVANNINNNDNSNNDNNNNNNNNDLNTNQVQGSQTATNTNTAMATAGRRLSRLKMMRDSVDRHMRRIQNYRNRSRRSSSGSSSSSSCGSHDKDVVDEALLAAVALMDMWKEVLFEDDPVCMAAEVCNTAVKLRQVSRLAGMMGQVGAVAAANMLVNFQGVNPEYLVLAAEGGADGVDCWQKYRACGHHHRRQ
ncbi:WD repeat-containing protein 48 homolog [Homarus americanus]|uniref:Putative adenylate cyclase, terminal-differentiation specific-like n=1 Tax=Homarus americanus TaxID=6706 RepID=A0A8J5JZG5_HOMAM|nr:WD repeat-containing protein 48 homolog [Homarus americanus]KAG7167355.1 putative adenylate cyclase, terminal-differentiation specific-like [Homarus americanus]